MRIAKPKKKLKTMRKITLSRILAKKESLAFPLPIISQAYFSTEDRKAKLLTYI
jgi:hypothetical protein